MPEKEIKTTEELLIDIIQETQKEKKSERRWGYFYKCLWAIGIIGFIGLAINEKTGIKKDHIAMVTINGVISPTDDANAKRIIEGLDKAYKNESVKGVIIKINSPGGSPVQAGMIHDEIIEFRTQYPSKKTISIIDDMGASAGYYIAVAAESIYANRASIVGSIGVRMDSFGAVNLMKKVGVERRLYTAGEFKGTLDMFTETNPVSVNMLEKSLKNVHDQFIYAVKKGRGDRLDANNKILFSGMFWTGEEGVDLGLIDGLKSERQLKSKFFDDLSIIDYTPKKSFMSSINKQLAKAMVLLLEHSPKLSMKL